MMKKLFLTGFALMGAFAFTSGDVLAHGGTYRGPGDVTPDPPGGSGGTTPGPSGPSTPGPSGPSTPGPSGPSTPGGGGPSTPGPSGPGGGGGFGGPVTGGGGAAVGDDLTAWEFWWEFNRDPFINLREQVHNTGAETFEEEYYSGQGNTVRTKDTLKPSESELLEVLAELRRALDTWESRQPDVPSSCLVAMAKIGKNHPEFDILPIFQKYCSDPNQEIQETAALAIGISQMPEGLDFLKELVLDTPKGREAVGGGSVNYRTRTFATYGLALIAWKTNDVEIKAAAFEALSKVIDDDKIDNRNIRVAAINSIGLLRPNPAEEKGKELLSKSIESLIKYFEKKLGTGEKLIQSHVAPAIAKLFETEGVDRTDPLFTDQHKLFTDILGGRTRMQVTNEIEQAVVVALGRMTNPPAKDDRKGNDRQAFEALKKYYERGKDQQARYFSLMALGQIGGEEARAFLSRVLDKGTKVIERPWAALSLGVMGHFALEGETLSTSWIDNVIGPRIFDELRAQKEPRAKSAMAVALGLLKYTKSADAMRALLEDEWDKAPLNGYCCIGLALMNDQAAKETIQKVIDQSARRPELLSQAAIALGKLGDKSVAERLQNLLTDGNVDLAKMSAIASGLGFIGDRRTIRPLLDLLFDKELTQLARAFAAVALGGVCDKELLVWNSKIAVNMNYRAAVETLTNRVNGILDIL